VTAYQLTPVGPSGVEPDRAVVLDIPTRAELLALLEETRAARDAAQALWREEVDRRIEVQCLLNRTRRVLASLSSMSPSLAGLVASAKREVRRRDEADLAKVDQAAEKARQIRRSDR